MSNREITETAKVLIKARALIEDPENWADEAASGPHKFCAMGAIGHIEGSLFGIAGGDPIMALMGAAEALHGNSRIPQLNDTLGHPAVLQMFDHAIQRELSKVQK